MDNEDDAMLHPHSRLEIDLFMRKRRQSTRMNSRLAGRSRVSSNISRDGFQHVENVDRRGTMPAPSGKSIRCCIFQGNLNFIPFQELTYRHSACVQARQRFDRVYCTRDGAGIFPQFQNSA